MRYAHRAGLVDHQLPYDLLAKPTKTALRKEKAKKPANDFAAKGVRSLLGKASPQITAMVLLGQDAVDSNMRKPGRSIDGLRHSFQTNAEETPARIVTGLTEQKSCDQDVVTAFSATS